MEVEKPEGARERDTYVKKGTIGQWTSIKDNFEECVKCPQGVTTDQLKQHNKIDDLWTVVRGTVYDCTQVLQ
jgi:cytochrome b involved in lipid metabolism